MSPGKGPCSKEITSSNHQFSGDMLVFRDFALPTTQVTSETWWLGDYVTLKFSGNDPILTHILEIELKPP